MSSFERHSSSSISVNLDKDETVLLRGLVEQTRSLLEERPADDPVMKRLFPAAYESPDDENAYRELIGGDLEKHKREAVDRVASQLGSKEEFDETLELADCETWLIVLTDLRLALGTRLGVTEETMGAEIDRDDPASFSLAILHWVGWLQESLLKALQSQ